MRAIVTGAAGLIGAHIVRALVRDGHDVRCLVRPSSRRDQLDDLPVQWIVADVADADLDAACAGCDVAFHTAALFAYGAASHQVLHQAAVGGTEALLRACARQHVGCVVVTSSSVVFGYSGGAASIDEAPGLTSGDGEAPYVVAKIAQHRRALQLARSLKLDVRFACPTMTKRSFSAKMGASVRFGV